MYLTLTEIAKKFNMTADESLTFAGYVMRNHRRLVFNNPDVSATVMLDQHVMKMGWNVNSIVCECFSHCDVKSSNEINDLQTAATQAVATFLAEYNKAGFEDFETDMRLEGENGKTMRRNFMSDSDTIDDIIDGLLLDEVKRILPDLQE